MLLSVVGVDVFIVHAAPEKDTALRLRAALAEHEVTAFVDAPDTPRGAPWDDAIVRELRDSLLQVVLLGEGTRWYQHEEIDIAIREMREHGASDRVVPVLLKARKRLPYGLNRVQALPWDGPTNLAAMLAEKVAAMRGASVVSGKHAPIQRRVRIAVVGLCDELADEIETLRRRIAQRTAILEGDVQRIDLVRDQIPDVDLRVVLLGSRHGNKLELVRELVAAARDVAARNTIIGAIDMPLRQVPTAYKVEAIDMQSLEVAITSSAIESVIDQLDGHVMTWYAARFPSRPGMSIARAPWEDRYLQDKAPLWRKGDPSALRTLGGTRVDRERWYVHLKADRPWVLVNGQLRYESLLAHAGRAAAEVQKHITHPDASVPEPLLITPLEWTDGNSGSEGAHVPDGDRADAARPWLDPVLSHSLIPRCVVVGAAGTGKTVLLQHLAWVLADDVEPGPANDPVHRVDCGGVRGHCPTPPVPVLHTATTVIEHLRGDRPIREALVALLRSSETFGDVADAAEVRAGINAGRYVFLIDSLDEVPRRQDREALVAALGTLTGPTPRVILTTRPSAHTSVELPDGFARVDIAPLDEDAAGRLARAWIACWAPAEDVDQVLRAVATMRDDFPAQSDERSPVENPLLLSCILQVYALYRRLPDDTAKLYSDMVRVLCEAKIRAADDHERDTLVERYREALRELFLASQELGGTRFKVTAAHERLVEGKFASRGTVENWLQALANHTGLVRFEGVKDQAVIRPWHRSYQEYLAAEAIALEYANRADDCITWLRESRAQRGSRLQDPSWRGTLRFLIGAAAHHHRVWGANLVNALMAAGVERSDDRARLYAPAAGGAAEYAQTLFQNEAFLSTIPPALADAFGVDGVTWPVHDRLDALEALGRLGDPRLLDPRRRDSTEADRGWVEIAVRSKPAGTGKMRSTERTRVTTFWIRRWPVTVAEFFPFVEDGQRDPVPGITEASWTGLVRGWRAQLRSPTRPIVDVSWYVARAFCAWAQVRWCLPCDGVVDLPTSAEWDIAAGLPKENRVPRKHLVPTRGSSRVTDSEHGVTASELDRYADLPPYAADNSVSRRSIVAPVGAFPRRHTAEGVWEMGVNVSEWCASEVGRNHAIDLRIDKSHVYRPRYVVHKANRWIREAGSTRYSVQGGGSSMPDYSGADGTQGFRLICRPRMNEPR